MQDRDNQAKPLLTQEELEGLLALAPHNQSADSPAEGQSEEHSGGQSEGQSEGHNKKPGPEESAAAEEEENVIQERQAQLELHWERSLAAMQQEIIELRGRVLRLERQLDNEDGRAAETRSAPVPIASSEYLAAKNLVAEPPLPEEMIPSRLKTHRARRGSWF